MNCLHCFSASTERKEKNDDENIDFILKQIIKAKQEDGLLIKKVILSGGEPLISTYINNITERLLENEIVVDVTTNGMLGEKILTFVKKYNIPELSISFDSLSPDKFSEFRGVDRTKFNDLLYTIDNLKKMNCSIHLLTVLTTINIDEIGQIIDFAYKNAGEISILDLKPIYRAKKNKDLFPNISMLKKAIQIIEMKRKEYSNFAINSYHIIPHMPLSECNAGKTIISIDSEGNVFSCPFLKELKFNLIEYNLAQIINMFNQLSVIQGVNKYCPTCLNINSCGKGCVFYIKQMSYDYICKDIFKIREI